MKADLIKQYTSLRDALIREKAQIESRLREIDEALGQPTAVPASLPSTPSTGPVPPRGGGRRPKGTISLKAAVLQATKDRPLTKPEILRAIFKLGFRTTSANPMHALNNLLYGRNPRFVNLNGRFSPVGLNTGAPTTSQSTSPTHPARRRKLSAAGRARISAAAKARWARIKKAGGSSLKAAG